MTWAPRVQYGKSKGKVKCAFLSVALFKSRSTNWKIRYPRLKTSIHLELHVTAWG